LISSTLLTLVVLPTLYGVFEGKSAPPPEGEEEMVEAAARLFPTT
jgi:hypothetical protein